MPDPTHRPVILYFRPDRPLMIELNYPEPTQCAALYSLVAVSGNRPILT